MAVLFGLIGAYLAVGFVYWLFVMTYGGFRNPDGSEAPLFPCLIATVLMWPGAVSKLEIL